MNGCRRLHFRNAQNTLGFCFTIINLETLAWIFGIVFPQEAAVEIIKMRDVLIVVVFSTMCGP